MTKNLLAAADFEAPPERLFEMYLDGALHAAFTGAPAKVEPRAGAAFSAFDGVLSGKILHVEPPRLVVQTWRSKNWPAETPDSILVLTFLPRPGGARIELTQLNLPEDDFAGVSEGWHKYYWTPWRTYLQCKKSA